MQHHKTTRNKTSELKMWSNLFVSKVTLYWQYYYHQRLFFASHLVSFFPSSHPLCVCTSYFLRKVEKRLTSVLLDFRSTVLASPLFIVMNFFPLCLLFTPFIILLNTIQIYVIFYHFRDITSLCNFKRLHTFTYILELTTDCMSIKRSTIE